MLTKDAILDANKSVASEYTHDTEVIGWYDAYKCMDIYARQVAIDFHDWQKKDQAECLADMSTEQYFEKYLKTKQ